MHKLDNLVLILILETHIGWYEQAEEWLFETCLPEA